MCWTSEILKEMNSEDNKIPIIKVLRMDIESRLLFAYYRGNSYLLNAEYSATILPKFITDYGFEINEGLHCYSNSCKARCTVGVIIYTPTSRAFAYGWQKRMESIGIAHHYKPVVVEGYIPPHTRYYINEDFEIVTQKLVLTNVLD